MRGGEVNISLGSQRARRPNAKAINPQPLKWKSHSPLWHFCFAEVGGQTETCCPGSRPSAAHPPGAHRAAVHHRPAALSDRKKNLPARQRRRPAPLSGLARRNSIFPVMTHHLGPPGGWISGHEDFVFPPDLTVFFKLRMDFVNCFMMQMSASLRRFGENLVFLLFSFQPLRTKDAYVFAPFQSWDGQHCKSRYTAETCLVNSFVIFYVACFVYLF